jgi:hypothetical protein
MKNEFFGDIRDYRKYGLLRLLTGGKKVGSAVCWMLTPDEDRPTKVDYLCREKTWRYNTCWHFDEGLFDALQQAVCVEQERNVARAKHVDILNPEVFAFHEEQLKDDIYKRREYFDRFLTYSEGKDLIFFDPDNGLETRGAPAGRKGSSKFIYLDELLCTFNKQHSILVFQFFRQIAPEVVINQRTEQIFSRLYVDEIASFKTPSVIFFLIPQTKHLKELKERSEQVERAWAGQIHPCWHHRTTQISDAKGTPTLTHGR